MGKFFVMLVHDFLRLRFMNQLPKSLFLFIYLFIYICLYTVKKHQVNNTYILQVIIKINTDNKN